jgi:hypothetical protein
MPHSCTDFGARNLDVVAPIISVVVKFNLRDPMTPYDPFAG